MDDVENGDSKGEMVVHAHIQMNLLAVYRKQSK